MARDVKALKSPYSSPSFDVIDINAAKAALQTKATSKDASAREMLSLIDKQLEEKKSAPNPEPLNLVS